MKSKSFPTNGNQGIFPSAWLINFHHFGDLLCCDLCSLCAHLPHPGDHVRLLSIQQRVMLMRAGLRDRDASVNKCAR
jgi:hypothetical protein